MRESHYFTLRHRARLPRGVAATRRFYYACSPEAMLRILIRGAARILGMRLSA